jgi:hypothetical protein
MISNSCKKLGRKHGNLVVFDNLVLPNTKNWNIHFGKFTLYTAGRRTPVPIYRHTTLVDKK